MSDTNVYQELYEAQKLNASLTASHQNIYGALFPHVAIEGVQLTLQEVIDLAVQKLVKASQDECAVEVAEPAPAEKATKKK